MFSSYSMSFAHMDTTRGNTTASICTCPPLLASCMDFPLWRAFEPPSYTVSKREKGGGGGEWREALEDTQRASQYINPPNASFSLHSQGPTGNTIVSRGKHFQFFKSTGNLSPPPSKLPSCWALPSWLRWPSWASGKRSVIPSQEIGID